jgi:hypothetical protein
MNEKVTSFFHAKDFSENYLLKFATLQGFYFPKLPYLDNMLQQVT